MSVQPSRQVRIVLAVTHSRSLGLMSGVPRMLRDEGWDVHVVANHGPELEQLACDGVTIHSIPMTREPSFVRDWRALLRWRSLLRSLRPDAVIAGTPKAGLLGMFAAFLTGTSNRIYHLRGLRLETVSGVRRAMLWAVEWLAMAASTEVLAVSSSLRERVVKLRLASPSKLAVVGRGSSNGVDVNRFVPGKRDLRLAQTLGIDASLPIVGFVGRLSKDKGIEELASASTSLQEGGVEHQLLVLGDVEDEGWAVCLAKLRNGGVRVVSPGRIDDVRPYYRLMTVFCLPTHREGFPNVVLEAAASGKCTVTTDATGARDSVIHNETGLLVPCKDPAALTAALRTVLTDSATRVRFELAARAMVEQHFSREVVQAATLKHLRERIG